MIIVVAPQVNVNDENVLVIEWMKAEGSFVKKGEVVGVIETTKALVDLETEGEGYFRPVAKPGDRVNVGGLLFILTESPDDSIESVVAEQKKKEVADTKKDKEARRWTKKAELLAAKHGVKIQDVPAVGIVREADVEQFLRTRDSLGQVRDLIDDVYRTNRAERVLVVGGGRGAVQVLDILWRAANQRPIGIVDDNSKATGKIVMGLKVLGQTKIIPELLKEDAFDGAIITFSNDLLARARLFEELSRQGVPFTNVIDPSVIIHSNVSIGKGNVIIANCRIGACAEIGNNNFLSAFVNIEHHNILGSHCTFGPGVLTSSRVSLGDRIRLGTGIFIEPGVKIGDDSIIASGAIITANVTANSIVKTRVETFVRPR